MVSSPTSELSGSGRFGDIDGGVAFVVIMVGTAMAPCSSGRERSGAAGGGWCVRALSSCSAGVFDS